MKKYQQIVNLLENLKLKGMIPNLDSEITEAEEKKISYLSFLDLLLKSRDRLPDRKKTQTESGRSPFPGRKRAGRFPICQSKRHN